MPVFNDKDYIDKAIRSILSQSFKDYRLIISDDCSTDGSEMICRKYANEDSRIRYVRQPANVGISRNMKFLLDNAETEYFMWAANDDLWDPAFIETLVTALDANPNAISAMSPTRFIDENDEKIEGLEERYTDYSGKTPRERLKKLIIKFDDCFGYGIFRSKEIKDVQFPVWKWINRNCPYNNIYPTLCYYLTKGDYVLAGKKPMWLNRLKPEDKINHKVPFSNTLIRYTFAFFLRKANLVMESNRMIRAAGGSSTLILSTLPYFLYFWVVRHTANEFRSRISLLSNREISFF